MKEFTIHKTIKHIKYSNTEENYYNSIITIKNAFIKEKDLKSFVISSVKCANYISPSTCKFSNKHCKFIGGDFRYSQSLITASGFLLCKIPHHCPLNQNRNPHKNFNFIITYKLNKIS